MDEPNILTECALFRGLRRAQIREMLPCLSARQARFRRGQFLLRAGDRASSAGIILSGEAEVLQEDFWGNRNLLAAVGPGELFAEGVCLRACCFPGERAVHNGRKRSVSERARRLLPLRKGLRAAQNAFAEPHPGAGRKKYAAE